MLKKPLVSTLAAAGLIFGATISAPVSAQEGQFITIGTGGVTGVYYPTGGAICRLVNKGRKEHGIRCSVESTGGSGYNVNTIRAGDLDVGVVQSDVQANAVNGAGDFEEVGPYAEMRALFSLHSEPLHVVVRPDSQIKSFLDTKGKRFNIGNPGSGQRITTDLIMDHLGWTNEDFKLTSELKSAEQSKALCDNNIDGYAFTVGVPSGSVKEAATTCNATIVPASGDWTDSFVEKYPAYAKTTIPGDMYGESDQDIETIGVSATIVTSTSLSDEVAYIIVKTVFDNIDTFKKLHPAFERLDVESMVSAGLSAPLHPGAEKYFKEAGLIK